MSRKSVVCFGEVLWDNLPEGRMLGGAPLNVCYHLNRSGIDSTIITKIGNDKNGCDLLEELKHLGIKTNFCQISETKPTSTVEVFLSEQNDVTYEIVEDVAWDEIEVSEKELNIVSNADAFVFGSLVARTQQSKNALLLLSEAAKFKVFDVNLRAPYYSKELISQLMSGTNLLKLNQEELNIISEWFGFDKISIKSALSSILEKFSSVKEIILTRGASGSVYFSGKEFIEYGAKKIKIINTVGSGDAFLAAFLASKLSGEPVQTALEKATLLSGFVATRSGACPEYSIENLHEFIND